MCISKYAYLLVTCLEVPDSVYEYVCLFNYVTTCKENDTELEQTVCVCVCVCMSVSVCLCVCVRARATVREALWRTGSEQ